ncbi:guanine nucleotide-binding protein-like 1 [Octopus sinensis]|uniref:Guanine nucleotide-binding protein-like 1 n=1 Tax=Octopus sinensis TaxID=2607531 RepID=A0A6P7TH66_9MOLL|nr:guanine nucleotide-binding protein-like 1 [Octopus sinensis]
MPRKKPFSVKQKKKQLQDKRERQRSQTERKGKYYNSTSSDSEPQAPPRVAKLNEQPIKSSDIRSNRYRLQFFQESKEEIEKNKKLARQPYTPVSEKDLEVDLETIYLPGSVLDIPKRPPWDYNLSKEQLDAKEEEYFKKYLDNIHSQYSPKELSYFELNLETWRQLWRVLEMSDIILLIIDIRHPAVHLSPALYDHVIDDLGKSLILILNKFDLVPPALVIAWKHYFQEKFPKLHIVCFSSFPNGKNNSKFQTADPGKVLHKRKKRGKFSAIGPLALWHACQNIVKDEVDLSSWKKKIEANTGSDESDLVSTVHNDVLDTTFQKHVRYKDGIVTLGCIGYPNVGKSSLMNGLVGKKVVSVSRTPGHTKHFQTIFLTSTVRLCDCPGLVFPSRVPKQLQILCGIYPIAQVREPYSPLMYLAQRVNLVKLLKLQHPNSESSCPESQSWSAFNICDALALKRGFITARTGRPDMYRAANYLLRTAVDGQLCLCFRPPDYTENKDFWKNHAETEALKTMQSQHHQRRRSSSSDSSVVSNISSDDDLSSDEGAKQLEKQQSHVLKSRCFATKKELEGDKEISLISKNPFLNLESD